MRPTVWKPMLPSTSANTRLKVGTDHGRAAARNPWQFAARFIATRPARQVDLVPDADGVIGDVRVAGEQRFARGGAGAGQHPVVAAAGVGARGAAAVPFAQPARRRRILIGEEDALVVGFAHDEIAVEG